MTTKRITKKIILVLALIFCQALPLLAQEVPCSGDPDDANYDPNCPLDTWVIVLVALALFFGYRQIQKQRNLAL